MIVLIVCLFFAGLNQSSAQELILSGEAKPGNLMLGYAPNSESVYLDTIKLGVDKGVFLFGFDRDETGTHYIKVKLKNGKSILKKIDLRERKYKIQRINKIKKKFVTPPESALKRIEQERKILKSAREKIGKTDTAYYLEGFIRPVKGGRVTSVFGSQRILNGIPKNPHNGLDIALPEGTPVYATSGGIVRLVGKNFYYNGNFVLIDHGQGLSSIYLHLSKILVKDGDRVKKGEKIGEIGTTGRSTGPHLHWGVQWFGKRIDPGSLLKLKFDPVLKKINGLSQTN